MKKLIRMHGFWTMVMAIGLIMCVITGHQMLCGSWKEEK